jgi:tRNA G18 (ribose-2'-O)-methylase SpoU
MTVPIAVLLHNIRSAHNVGSIFRTADAAGVAQVLLTGYTPLPVDRFGREQKEIAKTALGAEKSLKWEHYEEPGEAIAILKSRGYSIVGVEQDPKSIDYRQYQSTGPTVFIFGDEVRGISRELLDSCDRILEIPMHGTKESLNVSVTAGIILFQARG